MEKSNNSKKIWQTVNEYGNRNVRKVDNDMNEILNENNEIESDLTKIVEIFNKHYATVGENIANDIKVANKQTVRSRNKNRTTIDSIFLQPVSETEIKNIIYSLKNNSTPGFNNITTLTI